MQRPVGEGRHTGWEVFKLYGMMACRRDPSLVSFAVLFPFGILPACLPACLSSYNPGCLPASLTYWVLIQLVQFPFRGSRCEQRLEGLGEADLHSKPNHSPARIKYSTNKSNDTLSPVRVSILRCATVAVDRRGRSARVESAISKPTPRPARNIRLTKAPQTFK